MCVCVCVCKCPAESKHSPPYSHTLDLNLEISSITNTPPLPILTKLIPQNDHPSMVKKQRYPPFLDNKPLFESPYLSNSVPTVIYSTILC